LNALAERFVLSSGPSASDRTVPLGEAHLRTVIRDFVAQYHEELSRRGLGNERIAHTATSTRSGPIRCRGRLGGVLNFYDREAAQPHEPSFRTRRDEELRLVEDQNVLTRQDFFDARQAESFRLYLDFGIGDGHAVIEAAQNVLALQSGQAE
jgi:hypothetical protein